MKPTNSLTAGLSGIEAKTFQIAADKAFYQVIVAEPSGVIVYANRAAEKYTGYSQKRLIGQSITALRLWGGWMAQCFYQDLWRTVKKEKKKFIGEILNRRKNGTKYLTRLKVYPITDKDGNVKYMAGLEKNITADKDIDRTKTEFITLASHQLRTPLTNISLSLEVLLRDPASRLSEHQKDRLQGIYHDVHEMADLISTLLDTSRIQLGSFLVELKPVNVINTAEGALKEVLGEIYSKELRLLKDYDETLPRIMSDKNIIKTILHNLLTNAVKYTPANGLITLKVKRRKNRVLFQIADSGWGIPRGEQNKVFSKYFRAQNIKQKEVHGIGIGLYLTKLLIKSIQGKIWFSSRENEGTTFSVSLPLNECLAKKASKPNNS